MPHFLSPTEQPRELWGGRPCPRATPWSRNAAGELLVTQAIRGSRGTRADQGVCPTA